ncbi:MAG TPA: hypothetical protein VLK65_22145 [Vicinamibacteria bacterium]|nr:hypothetical protein [Vicinamibacteria bacterium]
MVAGSFSARGTEHVSGRAGPVADELNGPLNVFKHPDLRFQIQFPSGFQVQNTKEALLAGNREAAFQLTASQAAGNPSPTAHFARLVQETGIEAGRGQDLSIGGFAAHAAPFRVVTSSGILNGDAAVIRDGQTMYEILAYSSANRYPAVHDSLVGIIRTFARLKDPRALAIEPQRIRLFRVPREMSLSEALRLGGVDNGRLEEIALINHLRLDDRVDPGLLLKTVRGSDFRRVTE